MQTAKPASANASVVADRKAIGALLSTSKMPTLSIREDLLAQILWLNSSSHIDELEDVYEASIRLTFPRLEPLVQVRFAQLNQEPDPRELFEEKRDRLLHRQFRVVLAIVYVPMFRAYVAQRCDAQRFTTALPSFEAKLDSYALGQALYVHDRTYADGVTAASAAAAPSLEAFPNFYDLMASLKLYCN